MQARYEGYVVLSLVVKHQRICLSTRDIICSVRLGDSVKPHGKMTGHKIVTDVPAVFILTQRKRIRQTSGNYVRHDRKYTRFCLIV